MRRHWTLAALLSLSLVVGCGAKQGADTEEQSYKPRVKNVQVTTAKVKREGLSTDVELTGSLLPRRVTRVMSEIDGVVRAIPQVGTKFDVETNGRRYVEQLGIGLGQAVKKGDVFVKLDTRDLDLGIRIAEAKLTKARADLAKLKAWQRPEEVRRLTALRNEAKARYEQAVRSYNRTARLASSLAESEATLEQAKMEAATGKAVLDSAEANLAAGKAGPIPEEVAVQQALIDQAEAELQKQQRELEKATVRAPFDGVVTAFHVETGDHVSPASGPIAELMDVRYLIAEVGTPESYIGAVEVHDRAEVFAKGSTAAVPGLVVAINELVDPATRTFRTRIAIDNAERQFKAGQFARVRLKMDARESRTLTVPSRAVVFVEGDPHVFVVSENKAKLRAVKIGMVNDTTTEILSGVEEGTDVVTGDPSLLTDGISVTIKSAGEAAPR